MGAYYQGSADDLPFAWPADWHKPSPIKFLAVAPGAEFLTGIAARQPYPVGHDPEDDIALVKTWLCEGLEWLGAGAKTAKGYGRFQVIPG
jgi:CRISPR-associated protein Cmr6